MEFESWVTQPEVLHIRRCGPTAKYNHCVTL
jgi:hypothetical protein